MKQFETIDISGDAGIRAFGTDLQELFVNAAIGMYSLITDRNAVREKSIVEITLEGVSIEGLLVSWLNELIFRFDAYGFLAKNIDLSELVSYPAEKKLQLKASLSGEEFDPQRHKGELLIKAATYHKLRVEKTGDAWLAEVIFDI